MKSTKRRVGVLVVIVFVLLAIGLGVVHHVVESMPTVAFVPAPAGLPATLSPGARAPGCGRAWQGGQDVAGQLQWDGLHRTYLLHIPKGYDPNRPVPLVLNLHGTFMTAQNEAGLSFMSSVADREGFLVVYPNGTRGADGKTLGWNVFNRADPAWGTSNWRNVDDVGFLDALVARLENHLCVDTTRVDVTGMSNGASMAYHMACVATPWLAAVAPVAGLVPQGQCLMTHPIPLLAFNGVDDPLVKYKGQLIVWSVPSSVANYARGLGCRTPGQTGFAQGDVVETVYAACRGGATVQLYTITDGGHTWPGGFPLNWEGLGKTTYVINASTLMYAFFMAHPLTS